MKNARIYNIILNILFIFFLIFMYLVDAFKNGHELIVGASVVVTLILGNIWKNAKEYYLYKDNVIEVKSGREKNLNRFTNILFYILVIIVGLYIISIVIFR